MNKCRSAGIIATGHYVPEKVLTNFDLEKMVDTSDEWITTRTGIKERRIADESMATSDLAYGAALKVLEKANLSPDKLDCIIVATASPDTLFPSTACIVQNKLKAVNAAAFDLSAGCTGFVYSLVVSSQMISTGMYENILIIGAETLSRFMDWQDRNTCVIFGDGAGAVLVSSIEEGRGLLGSHIGSDGSGGDMLILPAGGSRQPASEETLKNRQHYIKMEGREVFKSAVRYMCEGIERALVKCDLTREDIDILIPHQANMRIIKAVAKRFKLKKDQVYINVNKYGNTSAASILIALDELVESGRVNKNDVIAITAFGSGYTWGGAIIKW